MSGNPGKYNFTIYRGATFSRQFLYADSNENPINLSGYTAEFKACLLTNEGQVIFDFTAAPEVVLGGALGTITLLLSAAQTEALAQADLVYSLTISAAGVVTPLLIGEISVSSDILP